MDFDLKLVRNDIAKIKPLVAKKTTAIFNPIKFKRLGKGIEGVVRGIDNVAIKWFDRDAKDPCEKEYIDTLHERSLLGLGFDIKYAPILDTLYTDKYLYAFMPWLKGPTLAKCTLEDLHAVGQSGFEQFFADIEKLSHAKLSPDLFKASNIIITRDENSKRHLSLIDFRADYTKETAKFLKADLVFGFNLVTERLNHFADYKKIKMQREILENLETAYKHI